MRQRYARPQHDRFLFAAHAIRVLAPSAKDRSSDDMVNWAKNAVALGKVLPEIPDIAFDMHTRRGQELGRDCWFVEEASRVAQQMDGRDERYRQWIVEAPDAGKLK